MNISTCFDRLITHTKSSTLPQGFKLDVVKTLEYFKVQSLCDIDRRESPAKLRAAWIQLKNQTRGLNLFESFDQDENFWRVVKCFVYEVEPSSLVIPIVERPKPEKPVSKFEKWEPLDFFNYMSKQVEARPAISDAERLFVLHGLYYLTSEAGKGRGQRNENRINQVWGAIQPLLEKMGFMLEFKNEPNLIYSVKLFAGALSLDKSK